MLVGKNEKIVFPFFFHSSQGGVKHEKKCCEECKADRIISGIVLTDNGILMDSKTTWLDMRMPFKVLFLFWKVFE